MVQRLLHNRWLRGVVTLLLLGALAYQAARLFWLVATPTSVVSVPTLSPKPPVIPTLPAIRLSEKSAISPTANTTSDTTLSGVSQPVSSDWTLTGTYIADSTAFAIIQTPQGNRVLGRGELLADHVVVSHIADDHVILQNAGQDITLTLADNTIAAVRDSTIGYVSPSAVRPAIQPYPRADNVGKGADNVVLADLWQRFQQLSWQLVSVDGQAGYQVIADNADDTALLSRYGLQSKDVIMAINGQPLSPQTLKSLSFSKKISAKIKRNATIQTIEINPTNP